MVTWNDFEKIWASASPLTPYDFLDSNYETGWNFVGATPPARQMWDAIQKKNDEKFKFLRDNFGTPNMVTTAAEMTDTDKIYVYVGSEAGWNSGHWYYYNEGTSSWEDGGVYNSVAFVTDTTLSIAGQPADAKAVGDALALKADLAGCTFTGNVNVSADLSVTGTSTLAGDVTASSDLSVAGDSALTNLSVSGTTALAGTSTAPTPSADDNSTKIATTEYVQTEIKPIETDVDIADKRISNIEKLLQGNLYDYQTDSSSAYTKSVHAGAMPYAGIEQIGGKTIVWNQLAPNGYDVTSNGSSPLTSGTTITAGHKYYVSRKIDSNNGSSITVFVRLSGVETTSFSIGQTDTAVIVTANQSGVANGTTDTSERNAYLYQISAGTLVRNTDLQITDLTLLYGAGNEPSTVAEFESMFPASYYPYNAGTLLSAGVTEVVSKDTNNATLQTIPIPTAIRNLEGYGWSADIVPAGYTIYIPCYNYVDYENKKFVQKIFRHTFNGQTDDVISYVGITTSGSGVIFLSFRVNSAYVHKTGNNGDTYNIVADRFQRRSFENISYGTYNNCYAIQGNWNVAFALRIEGFTTLAEYQTYLASNPLTLQWELATPIETDISQYLTDDNLINVEAGGTLTFPNSNGDDYRLPVPSEEEYMIDLQEAINNG